MHSAHIHMSDLSQISKMSRHEYNSNERSRFLLSGHLPELDTSQTELFSAAQLLRWAIVFGFMFFLVKLGTTCSDIIPYD